LALAQYPFVGLFSPRRGMRPDCVGDRRLVWPLSVEQAADRVVRPVVSAFVTYIVPHGWVTSPPGAMHVVSHGGGFL
jgi:hypothetical protein